MVAGAFGEINQNVSSVASKWLRKSLLRGFVRLHIGSSLRIQLRREALRQDEEDLPPHWTYFCKFPWQPSAPEACVNKVLILGERSIVGVYIYAYACFSSKGRSVYIYRHMCCHTFLFPQRRPQANGSPTAISRTIAEKIFRPIPSGPHAKISMVDANTLP